MSYTPPTPPQPMGRLLPPLPKRQYGGDNDPGPAEPIWLGILKITGFVGIIGAALGFIFVFVYHTTKKAEAVQQNRVVQAAEKGLVCTEEFVYDQRGGWSFCKVTFEGHTYATSANRAFYHLESCPCKEKAEK